MKPDPMGILIVAIFLLILIARHVLKTKDTQSQCYPFRRWRWDSMPPDWKEQKRQSGLCALMFSAVVVSMTVYGVRNDGINPAVVVAYILAGICLSTHLRIKRQARMKQKPSGEQTAPANPLGS